MVASKDVLFRRKCGSYPNCPICDSCAESIENVLLYCGWAKMVWFGGPLALKIDHCGISTFHGWCENMISKVLCNDVFACCCLFMTCWYIWKARCEFVFNGEAVDPMKVGLNVKYAVVAFFEANKCERVRSDFSIAERQVVSC